MTVDIDFGPDVAERIADILLALADVAAGDYTVRIPTDAPETDPFGALASGINEMVESLAASSERSQLYQQEGDLQRKVKMQQAALNLLKQLPENSQIPGMGNLTAKELISQMETTF